MPTNTLQTTSGIKGHITPVSQILEDSIQWKASLKSAYVQLFGIDRVAKVDSVTGEFSFKDLPEGRYNLRAFSSDPFSQTAEINGILVSPNESVTDIDTIQLNKIKPINATTIVPDGLIAFWPLDDGAGKLVTDAVGLNDGVLQGDPNWIPNGVEKGALQLDGKGDRVELPNLYLNGDFTLSAWVKLFGEISEKDAIIGTIKPGTNINFFDKKLRLFGGNIKLQPTENRDPVIAKTEMLLDVWILITVTRKSDTLNLYINANKDTTGIWDGVFSISTLGRGHTGYLEGQLDDIRVYERALEEFEIQQLYDKSSP